MSLSFFSRSGGAILLAFACPLSAQSFLTLAEAETLALTDEPGRAALESRATALSEQSIAAGELPDPKIKFGLVNYPVERGGFSTEPMTQARIGMQQTFPPGESLAFKTQKLEHLSGSMQAQSEARERAIRATVRHAWLELYYWHHAHKVIAEARPLFEDLIVTTRSLYAVGQEDQQDMLRAELELSRLDDRLLRIERQTRQTEAQLQEWIGDAARLPPADPLPSWSALPSLEKLLEQVDQHPLLSAAQAQIDAHSAGADIARERYKPGWTVGIDYAHRDGDLPNGRDRSGMLSLQVAVDAPLFPGNRQDRELAAALAEKNAAHKQREALRRQLHSQLHAEHARWLELSRQITLYEEQLLEQTQAQAEAALSAYQSDAGEFSDVMRGRISVLDTRLEHLRLRIDRKQSYATLARLAGPF